MQNKKTTRPVPLIAFISSPSNAQQIPGKKRIPFVFFHCRLHFYLFQLILSYPANLFFRSYYQRECSMGSQRVSTEAIVKGMVRKETAWRIISDFGNYPSIMKNVDKVVVHDRGERDGKSEWFVSLDSAPLHWLERDTYDASRYGIEFESIDGDFESIRGFWRVEDAAGEGIKLEYGLDYNLGIPVIEEVVGDIFREKMKKNVESMMQAVKHELDRPVRSDERVHPRAAIDRHNDLLIDGKSVRAYVLTISRKGMMFVAAAAPAPGKSLIGIGDAVIQAETFSDPAAPGRVRAVFFKEIRQDEFDAAVEYLTTKNLRLDQRVPVLKDTLLKSAGMEIPVHIFDVSSHGMRIGPLYAGDMIADAFEKKLRLRGENPKDSIRQKPERSRLRQPYRPIGFLERHAGG
jgi:ribosome-associated toxin RatA of RatAB toxin-antitoxin module